MKKYDIRPLKTYERMDIPELTEEQREFIIGTMLGDGCLMLTRTNGNAWLSIKHSIKQLEYVEWKYKIMDGYVNAPIKMRTDKAFNGKEYEKCEFITICHPVFTNYYNMFYDSGVKVVTNEIAESITPLALAVWFMDDGCGNVNSIEMCTESFTEPELKRLQKVLSDKFKLVTSLWFDGYRKGSNQKKFKIGILKRSVDTFSDIVKPYVIPSMMYKLRHRLSGTSETVCEAPQCEDEDPVQTPNEISGNRG
jgi:hypothetical protein